MAFEVILTERSRAFLTQNVSTAKVLERFETAFELLSAYPKIGRAYEPEYRAARVPFPCRELTVSDTPFSIFYVLDPIEERLVVIDIVWSAGDPIDRFR